MFEWGKVLSDYINKNCFLQNIGKYKICGQLCLVLSVSLWFVACDSEPPAPLEQDEVIVSEGGLGTEESLASEEPNLALLKSVEVVPGEVNMGLSEIQTARVVALFVYGRNEDVTKFTTFEADNPEIISIEKVSGDYELDGKTVESNYYKIRSLKPGETVIKVKWGEGVEKTVPVLVEDKVMDKIEVILNSKVHYLKYVDGVVTPVPVVYKIFAVYNDASMKLVESGAEGLEISVDNEDIATFDSKTGQLMANAPGKAEITVKYQGKDFVAPLEISTEENSVVSISADPDGVAVALGLQAEMRLRVFLKDQTSDLLNFDELKIVENPDGVEISFDPAKQLVKFKGLKQGEFKPVFSYRGLELQARVVVFEADKYSIAISSEKSEVYLGESVQFFAFLSLSDGTKVDVSSQCAWTSTEGKFSFDSQNGFEVGVGKSESVGIDEIEADFSGITHKYGVQVLDKKITGLEQRLAHDAPNESGGFIEGYTAVFNLFAQFSNQDVDKLEDSYLTQAGWACSTDAVTVDGGMIVVSDYGSGTSQVVKKLTASSAGNVSLNSACVHSSLGETVQVSTEFNVVAAVPRRIIIESSNVVESLDPALELVTINKSSNKAIYVFLEYSDGSSVNVTSSSKLLWNYDTPSSGGILGYIKQDGTLVANATAGTFTIDAHFEDDDGGVHTDSVLVRVE